MKYAFMVVGFYLALLGIKVVGEMLRDWETVRIDYELIPEPEASAYYDGRKLINDNQRNYIDTQAGRPVRSEGWSE